MLKLYHCGKKNSAPSLFLSCYLWIVCEVAEEGPFNKRIIRIENGKDHSPTSRVQLVADVLLETPVVLFSRRFILCTSYIHFGLLLFLLIHPPLI